MRIGIVFAALLAASAAPALAQDEADVAGLDWLGGHWVQEDAGRWVEEAWMAPRGGMMIGSARTGRGEEVRSFEFMRIATEADGSVHFHGSPGGAPATAFRLVDQGELHATFENPQHDFPNRIRYWREGDLLRAEISGPAGENATGWTYRRLGAPAGED